jgi:hypothetical protein
VSCAVHRVTHTLLWSITKIYKLIYTIRSTLERSHTYKQATPNNNTFYILPDVDVYSIFIALIKIVVILCLFCRWNKYTMHKRCLDICQ